VKTLATANEGKVTAGDWSLEERWHEGPIELIECCECGHKDTPKEFGYQRPEIEDLRGALRWSLEPDIRRAIMKGWDPPALTEVEQNIYATHISELQTGRDLADDYVHAKFGYYPSDILRLRVLTPYYVNLANDWLKVNE